MRENQASSEDYITTTVGCVTALLSYEQPSEAVIPPPLENVTSILELDNFKQANIIDPALCQQSGADASEEYG
jgi:hypothetical protein